METVYLLRAINVPIGGIKVIYRRSEMFDQLGFSSSAFYFENPEFICNWFDYQARIRLGQTKWLRKKMKCMKPRHFNLVLNTISMEEVVQQQLETEASLKTPRIVMKPATKSATSDSENNNETIAVINAATKRESHLKWPIIMTFPLSNTKG